MNIPYDPNLINSSDFNISQLIHNVTLQNSQGYKHVNMLPLLKGKFSIIFNILKRQFSVFETINYFDYKINKDNLIEIILYLITIIFCLISILIITIHYFISKDKKFFKTIISIIQFQCLLLLQIIYNTFIPPVILFGTFPI